MPYGAGMESDVVTNPGDFQPPRWLASPHVQSVLSASPLRRPKVRRETAGLQAVTRRVVVPCSDNVHLFAEMTPHPDPRNRRLMILIHGWEGSAESMYLLSAARRFYAAGFAIMRLNLRDHGDSHHLNEDLFHSCRLQEVVDAVAWAASELQPEQLILGGFSLGGNFALRVAAKAPAAGIDLHKVLAVCPVLDPEETMYALDAGSVIYQRYFLHRWRRSLMKKMQAFPHIYDFSELEKFKSLTAMTDFFVRQHTEYPDLHSYLKGYSLEGERLQDLQIESHVLLAEDDPVIPIAGLDRVAKSDALQVTRTRYGGHCGFLQNLNFDCWANDWLLAQL